MNYKSLALGLLFLICSPTTIAQSTTVLETIELTADDIEYFSEGAEFSVKLKNNACIIDGVSYTETSQTQYQIHFRANKALKMSYKTSIYQAPIYIDNNPKIKKTIIYHAMQDRKKGEEYQSLADLFKVIYNKLAPKTKLSCK